MLNRVLKVKAHTPIFASGWGQIGDVLPSPQKTTPGLKMTRAVDGVEVTAPGRVSFLIPWPNVQYCEIGSEEAKPTETVTFNTKSQAV